MRRTIIETLKEIYGGVVDYEQMSNEDLIMYMLWKLLRKED